MRGFITGFFKGLVNAPEKSAVNSTTTPLAANAVFEGEWINLKDLGVNNISLIVLSDQASAEDGVELQFNTDPEAEWLGEEYADRDAYTLMAGVRQSYKAASDAEYFRVRYTNGPTPQTEFLISTMLHRGHVKPSTHRLGGTVDAEDDAELMKTVVTGKLFTTTTYPNVETVIDDQGRVALVTSTQVEAILESSTLRAYDLNLERLGSSTPAALTIGVWHEVYNVGDYTSVDPIDWQKGRVHEMAMRFNTNNIRVRITVDGNVVNGTPDGESSIDMSDIGLVAANANLDAFGQIRDNSAANFKIFYSFKNKEVIFDKEFKLEVLSNTASKELSDWHLRATLE